MPTGSFTVKFSRNGWDDVTKTVTVEKGKTTTLEIAFPAGNVEITSTPSGVEVSDASGKSLGPTPYTATDVRTGPCSYRLLKEGYANTTVSGNVEDQLTLRLNVAMGKYRGPVAGEPWTVPSYNIEMVWIAHGTFTMGSPESESGRGDNETQHRVTLSKGYWLGKYEVTQGQWQAVMGNNPSRFKNAGANARLRMCHGRL